MNPIKPVVKKERHHDQAVEVMRAFFPSDLNLLGLEVGTNSGVLTQRLLEELPIALLFTCDPWMHFPGQGYEAGEGQEYHNRQEAEARKRCEAYEGRVSFMKMTSDEAFETFRFMPRHEPRGLLDFVWIDGHHEYSQVVKDLKNGWDFVLPGGILGGHDYKLVPDVTRAVEEFMTSKGLTFDTGGDFTWWVQKPLEAA